MSALFSFEQIIKALAKTSMLLFCVIVITLLTTSCSTAPTKQTTLTDTTANSLATKEKSDKELECRTVTATGSRFSKKVCEYKETWAAIDKKNNSYSEELVRKLDENSGIINPEGKPGYGMSPYNDAMTPPGGY